MLHSAYNLAWRAAAPWIRRRLSAQPEQAALLERFAPAPPALQASPIWIHACSVGELATATPLLRACQRVYGKDRVLLTTSTATGRARAEALEHAHAAYLPFDHPASMRRFVQQVRPGALVLMETELWPNLLRECDRLGVPVLVANARLSDKHYQRYARFRGLVRAMFTRLDAVAAQNQTYAERFVALGTPEARVRVLGNLKFDSAQTEVPAKQRVGFRTACGIPESAPLLVFGSTRPGDEALASACWATLREEHPTMHLVVAPRHVERREEIRTLFGEPVLLRSESLAGKSPSGERVLLLDTLGELAHAYASATLAVIGGSFYPGVEGHNPLEPAALGVPVVFGSHMANFPDAAAVLLQAEAARQAACPEDLYPLLSNLLRDAASLRQLGTRARRAVLDGQGATQRNLEMIREWVAR